MKEEKQAIDGSLYRVYKHATNECVKWGSDTWAKKLGHKNNSKRKKKGKNKASRDKNSIASSLQKLVQLAELGVPMPKPVQRQLETAIRLRTKASKFYISIPTTTPLAQRGHDWVIQQLEEIRDIFIKDALIEDAPAALQLDADSKSLQESFAGLCTVGSSDDEESVEQDNDPSEQKKKLPKPPPLSPPTSEEIKEEEKAFAAACALSDIIDTLLDVKRVWKKWATREWTKDDHVEVGELESATLCSRYAAISLDGVRAELETTFSVESDFFERILENDKVVPSATTSNDGSSEEAEETLRSLKEIYAALNKFDADAVPKELDDVTWKAKERSGSQKKAVELELNRIKSCRKELRQAIRSKNVGKFTAILVKNHFPIWLQYEKNLEGSSRILWELDNMKEARTVKFGLVVQILILAFSAFELEEADPAHAQTLSEMHQRVFLMQFSQELYEREEGWLDVTNIRRRQEKLLGEPMATLYRAQDFINNLSPISFLLPLFSGEIVFCHLARHLFWATTLPHVWKRDVTSMIHIYRILRNEGYLGRISMIDTTLFAMFPREIFFRGGLAHRGKYLNSFNLAIGYKASGTSGHKLLKGGTKRHSSRLKPEETANHHMGVIDISEMMQIVNLETVPFVDREKCFSEIHAAATKEMPQLYMSPLQDATMRMFGLIHNEWIIEPGIVMDLANQFFDDYADVFSSGRWDDTGRIIMWAAILADADIQGNNAFGLTNLSTRRHEALTILANGFRKWFPTDDLKSGEEISFTFSQTIPRYKWSEDDPDRKK